MKRDAERMQWVCEALDNLQLDALICALPTNVLMLSGYWPVVGLSLAIATRDGQIFLAVPEDEKKLAEKSWANETLTFSSGSLDEIETTREKIQKPLIELMTRLNLFTGARFGCEGESDYQPASYASMHLPGPAFLNFLREMFHQSEVVPVEKELAELRARLTGEELKRLRAACQIAERAFLRGAKKLRAGLKETAAANFFRAPLTSLKGKIQRADGFVYCMSGPNSFEGYAAFQRSRSRTIEENDLVLIHCNSYADGFWTDITRTFCIGEPDEQKRKMFAAVFAARDAALATVRPGVGASAVDEAARSEMKQHGFEKEFRHPTGHGVGFAAIDHNALPRLHPKSNDRLQAGMVFNLEPGIYLEGLGGMRHCDMVLVTESGAEILTPFQSSIEELILLTGKKEMAL